MVKAMTASLAVPHFGYKDEIILNELVRYGIFDTWEFFTVWAIPRYVSMDTLYYIQSKSWQISDFFACYHLFYCFLPVIFPSAIYCLQF